MHRPRGAVWFFQHLIIALSQHSRRGLFLARVMHCHSSAAALQANRAYGEPLANFFPQASRLITAHFAHHKLRKNASGSIVAH